MRAVNETEEAVIGALLLEPALAERFGVILAPEDFAGAVCAEIYRAALASPLETVEAVGIASRYTSDAPAFIRGCMDLAPSRWNAENLARSVHDAARLRRLRAEAHEAIAETGDGAELADRLITAGRDYLAADVGREKTMTTALIDVMQELDRGQADRLDTGFTRLDTLLKGLYPGQLVLIGARPGVGKSAFALNLAMHAARAVKVILFSMEMTAREIAQRGIVSRSPLPLDAFLDGKIDGENVGRIAEAAGELSKLPIVIDDRPYLTAEQLRARVRLHPDARLVIVDYLGLMQTARRDGNRNLELGELARKLKTLANSAAVPVIALSQLNRGTDDDERPGLRSLRDSGELEQHADKVLLLWRTEKGLIGADVAKNRQGRTGVVQFEFDGAHMLFRESPVAYDYPEKAKRKNRTGFKP